MSTIASITLKLVVKTISEFSSRQDNPVNISNWSVQLLGNDRVKASVTTSGVIASVKYSVTTSNFQPARFVQKGAWIDVTGGKSEASKILKLYDAGLPAKVENLECLALLGYFTTLNVLGKPVSAVSGGRAVLINKIINSLKVKDLTIKIDGIGSGGQGDQFGFTLDQAKIESFAAGGKWRGELVLALPAGGKRANSGDSINADEWV